MSPSLIGERAQRRLIVRLHQAAVAENVDGQYGDQLARRLALMRIPTMPVLDSD